MTYIENPKTKGSGIICAIPQQGRCPMDCDDCFFQSGRSFLEPLDENTPNMPSFRQSIGRIVRVNDGNDSSIQKDLVIKSTKMYQHKFYNTSIPNDLRRFYAPVVLTINPGKMTDTDWHKLLDIPKNLMFVRIRANTWNINTVIFPAIKYYTLRDVPVVLTFMAYYDTVDKIPENYRRDYEFTKRTLNSYYCIIPEMWEGIMNYFKYNKLVHSCGKDANTHDCKFCGNCLREYFKTKEVMRNA